MDNNIYEISISSLRYDTADKVRHGIDDETIDRYTERWKEYKKELKAYNSPPTSKVRPVPTYPFPPITVTKIKSDRKTCYDIISGAYRARSATKAGMEIIHAEIVEGTTQELIEIAISANSTHGKPLSEYDVRSCFLALDEEDLINTISRPALAKLIGCSKSQVNRVLKKLNQQLSDLLAFATSRRQL